MSDVSCEIALTRAIINPDICRHLATMSWIHPCLLYCSRWSVTEQWPTRRSPMCIPQGQVLRSSAARRPSSYSRLLSLHPPSTASLRQAGPQQPPLREPVPPTRPAETSQHTPLSWPHGHDSHHRMTRHWTTARNHSTGQLEDWGSQLKSTILWGITIWWLNTEADLPTITHFALSLLILAPWISTFA